MSPVNGWCNGSGVTCRCNDSWFKNSRYSYIWNCHPSCQPFLSKLNSSESDTPSANEASFVAKWFHISSQYSFVPTYPIKLTVRSCSQQKSRWLFWARALNVHFSCIWPLSPHRHIVHHQQTVTSPSSQRHAAANTSLPLTHWNHKARGEPD